MAQLRLNPGVPRPRPSAVLRYLCWVIALVATVIIFQPLYSQIRLAVHIGQKTWSPHKQFYHNGSLGADVPSMLPMIEREQLFDIGVTVWLRHTEEEEEAHRREHQVPDGEDDDLLETPLYADIPLKGLTMSDKSVSANVTFRVPTARFHGVNLTSLDLRGSFVIIPASPSPADRVFRYANYLQPDRRSKLPWVKYWPARPAEFPLGSNITRRRSMREAIIDTMSAQVPLVAFYKIEDLCSSSPKPALNHSEPPNAMFLNESASDDRHPYIITRTQLRLRDETHPLNATMVALQAASLGLTACGRDQNNRGRPLRRVWCYANNIGRHYKTHGHWETIYSLRHNAEVSGLMTRNESRYSPYLDTMLYGYTPKDLVRVPVRRGNCSTSEEQNVQDPNSEYMDITWHISFSGRSSPKAALADQLSEEPLPLDAYMINVANQTISFGGYIQEYQETWQGVIGHRHDPTSHPRRRWALRWLGVLLMGIVSLLEAHYWFTRRTTAGVSLRPAQAIAAARLVRDLVVVAGTRGIGFRLGAAYLVVGLKDTAMASLLWTLGWHMRWRWVPAIRHRALSHRERASERLDARTSVAVKIAIFGVLFATYVAVQPHSIEIVPRSPALPHSDRRFFDWQSLHHTLATSTLFAFNILQAVLNARSGTFAGAHRVVPMLHILQLASGWVTLVPSIVGATQRQEGISLHSLCLGAIYSVLTVQAIWYPAVKQIVDEDEA